MSEVSDETLAALADESALCEMFHRWTCREPWDACCWAMEDPDLYDCHDADGEWRLTGMEGAVLPTVAALVAEVQRHRAVMAEVGGHHLAYRIYELGPTLDHTPTSGLDWRGGLDALDELLNDCAQDGIDYRHHVRVSAVRDIVHAVRRYEDGIDESIQSAHWEDAVTSGQPWATGERDE